MVFAGNEPLSIHTPSLSLRCQPFSTFVLVFEKVREKAREMVDLLQSPERVRFERLRARNLKAQYSGYGSQGPSRPSLGDYDSSSRDLSSSRKVGGGTGGGGRDSGDISDDWTAGYDRSPTPPSVEARRVEGHRRTSSTGSDKIDFYAGREEYSGRLSRYQEKERKEASLGSGSRSRRCVLLACLLLLLYWVCF